MAQEFSDDQVAWKTRIAILSASSDFDERKIIPQAMDQSVTDWIEFYDALYGAGNPEDVKFSRMYKDRSTTVLEQKKVSVAEFKVAMVEKFPLLVRNGPEIILPANPHQVVVNWNGGITGQPDQRFFHILILTEDPGNPEHFCIESEQFIQRDYR